jgi:hypothetical protein
MKNFYSPQFDSNKTYNLKTFALDGTTLVQEVNIKYLFGYKESSLTKVWRFFFDKTFIKNLKNGETLPEDVKKDINDTKCRYILCEKEVISYDTDGDEFSRETSFYQYDKTCESFNYQKGKKITRKPNQVCTRLFNTIVKVDNLGNQRTVLVPGGINYSFAPGTLPNKQRLCGLKSMKQVEVKMIDSLTIL